MVATPFVKRRQQVLRRDTIRSHLSQKQATFPRSERQSRGLHIQLTAQYEMYATLQRL
jgi:hypothetical protein